MKNILSGFLLFFPICLISQNVPTVYATGGMDPNKWDKYVQEVKSSYDEWEWKEFGLISATCSEYVKAIGASTTLEPQGSNNYYVGNLVDFNYQTAWVEGKSDYGEGEYFIVQAEDVTVIYNGYQKSQRSWTNNSRVKKFKVYRNNELICYLKLSDLMGPQSFLLPVNGDDSSAFEDSKFKFEIIEVYKGDRWPDVAITHIGSYTCCLLAESEILKENGVTQNISQVNVGDKIKTVDLNSNKTETSKVIKVVNQRHSKVLEISTKNHVIKATPDHPFYIKHYGFLSLKEILIMEKKRNYENLINEVQVLVWSAEKNKTEFQKITNIKTLQGSFETYTILDLEHGNNFIANGFITAPY